MVGVETQRITHGICLLLTPDTRHLTPDTPSGIANDPPPP
jgi:hypothetical protein